MTALDDELALIRAEQLADDLGMPLAAWQRELLAELLTTNAQVVTVMAPRRAGRATFARAWRILVDEPWRLADRPRWPTFVLVPLPARLERALDRLLAPPPWRTS